MDNELQVLGHWEIFDSRFTIYGTAEKPLFLAKEVAEKIEYDVSSLNKMVALAGENEKVRKNVPTPGGVQSTWFLTENGLYEVLMQSRKPIAKKFKERVKEILHELRTKGKYEVKPLQEDQSLTFDGMKVMTLKQAGEFLGISTKKVYQALRTKAAGCVKGRDYIVLAGVLMSKLRKENPAASLNIKVRSLVMLFSAGVEKVGKYLHLLQGELPLQALPENVEEQKKKKTYLREHVFKDVPDWEMRSDTPENEAAKEWMQNVQGKMTALNELLELFMRYNPMDFHKSLYQSIQMIGTEIFLQTTARLEHLDIKFALKQNC